MVKAQVTVFIIIAVVVVAAIGGAVYMSQANKVDKEFFNSAAVKPQVNNIQTGILDCAEQTSMDAIEIIGIQGGYYDKPNDYFDLGWAFIPYYYNQGKFSMPLTRTIEMEIKKAVDDNLNFCLDELDFEGFDLSYKTSRTKVSIKESSVELTIDIPVVIEKEGKKITFELEEFPLDVESNLQAMLEVADYITEGHKENPEMICISCVADMARERDLFVDMLDFDGETTTLIVITNNQSSVPFAFEFLNKYPENSGNLPIPGP